MQNFNDAPETASASPARTSFIQHPVLLLATFLGALLLIYKSWPPVVYMFTHQTPEECGNISDRPFLPDPTPLAHDRYCTLQGTVQSLAVLTSGGSDDPNPQKANKGRKYYVKLDGDRIFAILDANDPNVNDWRIRKGSLLGFGVTGPGRIIDPEKEPGSALIATHLRRNFAIPDSDAIRIFDTLDRPFNRWPKIVICVLMAFTACLTLVLFVRRLRQKSAA